MLLPYTPLHHLLFRPVPGSTARPPTVLVMTSGNLTDEPICYDDADAKRRLRDIVDSWLLHDRPIHVPCDDSVVRVEAGQELPIRRSRGYAPLPVRLPFEIEAGLAVGGELKNTFCLASGRNAWMSQHIGDMGSVETLAALERSVRQFCDMYEVRPDRPPPTLTLATRPTAGPRIMRGRRVGWSSTITPTSRPPWSSTPSLRANG